MGGSSARGLLSWVSPCYIPPGARHKPGLPLARTRDMNTKNLITIVSVAILVGTEILGAALALGWALGGMFELPDLWRQVLIGVFVALGAYGVWRFVQNAMRIEPVFKK
jgi:hypothetical protein